MDHIIWVESEGSGNVEKLKNKIFELTDEFSKEGVEIQTELKESLRFGAVGAGTIILTICGWIAVLLISKLISKLFEKDEDAKNVNIQINIKEINTTFSLPEDKQKILDYYKNKNTE